MNRSAYYLEDMELLRMSAELRAKKKGLELKTFSNSRNFLKAIKKAPKEIILFLDSNLGEKIRGEEIGKVCFENGFKDIFLITSYEKSDFPSMPWIKDIGQKDAIFKFWNQLEQ